jgi:hypothetical protein
MKMQEKHTSVLPSLKAEICGGIAGMVSAGVVPPSCFAEWTRGICLLRCDPLVKVRVVAFDADGLAQPGSRCT